jgi:hypothetical protein
MAKSRYSLHIRTLYVQFTVTIYFVQVDNTSECISKLRTRERGVDVIPNTMNGVVMQPKYSTAYSRTSARGD